MRLAYAMVAKVLPLTRPFSLTFVAKSSPTFWAILSSACESTGSRSWTRSVLAYGTRRGALLVPDVGDTILTVRFTLVSCGYHRRGRQHLIGNGVGHSLMLQYIRLPQKVSDMPLMTSALP